MGNELRHGTWWNRATQGVPVADLMEGRFTRLFPNAPAAQFDEGDLTKLAEAMTATAEVTPTPETETDPEENTGIAAAYTYLGQFIDHDLTFDPVSHLRHRLTKEELQRLVEFRTPRFDLDNVYGRGPGDQPYLYDSDGVHLLLGDRLSGNAHDPGARDLQRGPSGRALIGDPRNDENRIVAQLHATIIRFHNRMADLMKGHPLEDVRDQVRWHYQWVVVNDFVPTVIARDVAGKAFPHLLSGRPIATDPPKLTVVPNLQLIPVEFSVAAYRFGHSMIRPEYRLNETITRRPIFSIFPDVAADLGGFRPIPDDWAIDWQCFIDLDHGAVEPTPPTNPFDPIVRKPQRTYKIDTSLVNPLGTLPPSVASNPSSLTLRNLLRGKDFGLPSGQTVATALGETPIDDHTLVVGKATKADAKQQFTDISPKFADNVPLWAYILSEAQVTSWAAAAPSADLDAVPVRLGPVGGRIVAEVFATLLATDRTSLLDAGKNFTPRKELTHNGTFGLAELINAALGRKP